MAFLHTMEKNNTISTADTLLKAADIVTQEPIIITVDVFPVTKIEWLLQKLRLMHRKKTFIIRPICLGTLIRIAKLLTGINIKIEHKDKMMEAAYTAIEQHAENMAEIVALAITNTQKQPGKKLVQFVLQNFTSQEILAVFGKVLQQMDLTSFMSSIILAKGMSVLEMNPSAVATNAEQPEVSL